VQAKVDEAVNAAKEGLLDADAVQAKVDEAVAAAKEGLLDADAVQAKVDEAVNAAKEGLLDVDAVKAQVEEAVDAAKAEGEKALEEAKAAFEPVKADLEQKIADLEEKAKNLFDADAVQAKITEAVDAAKAEWESAKESVTETVNEVKDAVEDKVEEVTDAVEDKVEEVTEAAEEVAEEVTEAAEEAVAVANAYADFAAAELDSEVTVETYIQSCAYAPAYGNASAFCQTEDGAVYLYRLPCDDELAAKLVPGAKVKVTGFKSEWSGEVEIIDISAIEVLDAEAYIAPAVDLTALLGTDELINYMNQFVSFTDLEVVAYNEAGDAFSYAWDGSGSHDANSDLYFNVAFDGNTYGFTVESDECDNTTAVYAAVEGLKVGDKIDAEAFLYWYNGANPHVTSIIVK
ncbi:MAG: hypothetical protein MJ142_07865, partial [Clostridia bacterium]|nr:hypothetical protein [Clostridia bacterium]